MNTINKEDPITLLVIRKPIAGKEAIFEKRLSETIEVASAFPGHLGVDIIKPSHPNREYRIIVRFASERQLDEWQASAESAEWLGKLEELQDKPAYFQRETGLERWFLSESQANEPYFTPPPRYKMALLSMVGAFPTIIILLYALDPLLRQASIVVRAAVLVPLMVLALTYFVMPLVSTWFSRWLKRT